MISAFLKWVYDVQQTEWFTICFQNTKSDIFLHVVNSEKFLETPQKFILKKNSVGVGSIPVLALV